MKPFVVMTMLIGLTGCVTLSPAQQAVLCEDISLAMREPPEALRHFAETGQGHAELAYAIVLRYGLNGVTPDAAMAADYRARATAPRNSSTTYVWIAAIKKMPGHIMPVTTYSYDVEPVAGKAVEDCAAALAGAVPQAALDARLAGGLCGGPDNYQRLQSEWRSVAPH